jgi:aspartate/methionine/tyrosine aminotransferase
MEHLRGWVAEERLEILARKRAMLAGFETLPGWDALGCGAYFAYVTHPFEDASDVVARRLVQEAAVLMLPGTMFNPLRAQGGTGRAEATLRIAFANANIDGITTLFERLRAI